MAATQATQATQALRSGREAVAGRMHMCTSFAGRPLDAVISNLQKQIRRGNFHAAVGAALDNLLTGLAGRTALHKSILTRLMNRLRVISVEDVGVASPLVVQEVDFFIEQIQDALPPKKQRLPAGIKHLKGAALPLLECVQLLCAVPKLRLVSDVKTYAALPPFYKRTTQRAQAEGGPVVRPRFRQILSTLRSIYKLPKAPEKAKLRSFSDILRAMHDQLEGESTTRMFPLKLDEVGREERQSKAEVEMESLQVEALHSLSRALDFGTFSIKSVGYRNILLQHFDNIIKHVPMHPPILRVVGILRKWAKGMTHNERPIYLIQALLLASRAVPVDIEAPPPAPTLSSAQLQRLALATQSQALAIESLFEPIPDFSLDQHTSAGRAKKATGEGFAKHSAVVANEVGQVKGLRHMYNHLKVLLDQNLVHRTCAIDASTLIHIGGKKGGVPCASINSHAASESRILLTPSPPKKIATKKKKKRSDVHPADAASAVHARPKKKRCMTQRSDPAPVLKTKDYISATVLTQRWTREQMRAHFGEFPQTDDIELDEEMVGVLMNPRARLVAQRCTARFKPPTYITGALTIKGPYKQGSKVPQRVLDRSARLHAWGAGDTILQCVVLSHTSSKTRFLAFRTVGSVAPTCQNTIYYQWSTPPMKGFVAVRASNKMEPEHLSLLSHRLIELGKGALTSAQWLRVFQHLLMRFVLNCGDSGLWNMILDTETGEVWGIDMEDMRHTKGPCESVWAACFHKRSARASLVPIIKQAMVEHQTALHQWLMDRWTQAQKSGFPPTDDEAGRWTTLLSLAKRNKWLP